MKVGDLVLPVFPGPQGSEREKVGIIMLFATLNGVEGAWVSWSGKGIYWSPVQQLEIIGENR